VSCMGLAGVVEEREGEEREESEGECWKSERWGDDGAVNEEMDGGCAGV
jgi:hypothetical protein